MVAQTVKRLPTMRETWVWSLSWEDLLEKETATHSSTLAWKIPWTEEPGRLQSMGLQRVQHDWATSLLCFYNAQRQSLVSPLCTTHVFNVLMFLYVGGKIRKKTKLSSWNFDSFVQKSLRQVNIRGLIMEQWERLSGRKIQREKEKSVSLKNILMPWWLNA